MNTSSGSTPIEKAVVLVGAGNAHLVFAKRWGMNPVPGVAVTLVSEAPVIPYSAMVPAHIAGDYSADDITIDLVRFCQNVKIRFLAQRVVGIDSLGKRVLFADRPPVAYDVLSLGLGSLPSCPGKPASPDTSLIMRPLGTLLRKLDALAERLRQRPSPFHLVVVGGGASGCELALAIHKRFHSIAGFRLTLLQGHDRLLPQFPAAVAHIFERQFQGRGITFRVNARVVDTEDRLLILADGDRVAFDSVLWATQASPPSWIRASGLTVDDQGFLRVKNSLQSVADPSVFGTGDCVAFDDYPDLHRNGVYAVREGPVLFDNVVAFLHEKSTRPFRPQRRYLCLLNTADGQAVLCYGPLTWKSRWARRLKDRIDRAWITKFTQFAPMAGTDTGQPESYQMRCGGCGSKISSDVLSAVLKRIDLPDDPRVVMGCRAGEDAAVHRVRPDLFSAEPEKLLEVQTVDYFKAFIDDPYLFGRIAAQHAVSDLFAMNARPFSALAIATLPYARGPIQQAQLFELLSGAVHTFRDLGVVLTGGHTTEGSELALGFAVTGFAEEGRLFQKSRLQAGDALILTKPLGTGALLAAWMRGECRAGWFQSLVAGMLQSNAEAAKILQRADVQACTDVTGFGLAGHLLEMLDASRLQARLFGDAVPLYPGFHDVVGHGIVSTLHQDNAKVRCRISTPTSVPEYLFDPQTSGGLLAGVRPELAESTLTRLHQAGFREAAVIGAVVDLEPRQPPLIVIQEKMSHG